MLTEIQLPEQYRVMTRAMADRLKLKYVDHINELVKCEMIQKVDLEEFLSECKIPVRLTSTKRRARVQK